jgi:mannose-6-phosphate isomerase-like protein (cupin superfamily)
MKWFVVVAMVSLAAPALAQEGAPPRPVEPLSNERVGISIDRFIGDANTAPSRVSHEVMLTRSILRKGDPHQPGDRSAVLRAWNDAVLATLPGRNATPLTQRSEQLVFVVQSGEGRVDDGRREWDLRPGIAVLVPPNRAHRLTNTGTTPLKMVMLSRDVEPEVTPRTELLVRDIELLAYTEQGGHWSNMAKYVFSGAHPDDGLHSNERLYIVYMGPMTIAGPHAHNPETEEVWIKITDGEALMQLGSEIRPWPMNVGFLAPPNAQTVHAALNLSDEIQGWLYFSRSNLNAPHTGPGTGPSNPVIAEALQRATIAGRPLQASSR